MKSLPLRCWGTIRMVWKHQVYIFFICQILQRESYHEKANKYVNVIYTWKMHTSEPKTTRKLRDPGEAFKTQALEAFYTTQTKPMGSKQFACLRQYTHKHTNYVVLEQLICHNSFKWLRESKLVWMVRKYILACWVIPLSNICKRILYCSRASPSSQTNTEFLIWTIMKYNSKEHNAASSF